MLRVRERKEAERALGVPSCVRERVSYHCGTLPVSFYSAPSAPDRNCPPGRPSKLSTRMGALRHTQNSAPSWRRCRGASSRGAAWRRSPRTPPPRSAAAARPAAGARRPACPQGARQHVLLAGQLEAHAPQAPEEVGLVQELQDGAAQASTCCLTRCATCSSVRCARCLVAPPSSFTGSQSLRS